MMICLTQLHVHSDWGRDSCRKGKFVFILKKSTQIAMFVLVGTTKRLSKFFCILITTKQLLTNYFANLTSRVYSNYHYLPSKWNKERKLSINLPNFNLLSCLRWILPVGQLGVTVFQCQWVIWSLEFGNNYNGVTNILPHMQADFWYIL